MQQKEKKQSEHVSWQGRGVRLIRERGLRRFKLQVHPNSTIEFKIPSGWSQDRILGILDDHQVWLESALQKAVSLRSRFQPRVFKVGEEYLVLGKRYYLDFQNTASENVFVELAEERIVFFVPQNMWFDGFLNYPHPKLEVHLMQFYNKQAEKTLIPLFWSIVKKVGYGPQRLSLRNQRTIWGSCSRHRSSIQINKKLIAAPIYVIEYVMIHELAHLKHPNHSRHFWDEVAKHCTDYKQASQWLLDHHYDLTFLEDSQILFATSL